VTDPSVASGDRSPSPRGRLGLTLLVAALVLAADQLSKWWALERLDEGDIDLFWTLRLRLTFNSGMAFSQGRGLGPVIGALALVVVVVLVLAARKGASTLGAVAVGMVLGGAAGNLADRLFRTDSGFLQGRVVDFIDLQWWPVFNVADAAIVIGGIVLVLAAGFGARESTG
jgi:signal peptidase II